MTGFVELLTAAQTRWDAAALLLTTWNARPTDARPQRRSDGFLEIVDEVRAHFDDNPDTLELTDADRSQILAWTKASAFPVRLVDDKQQTDRVLQQLDDAIEAAAQIIVLPELSTTPDLVRRVQRRPRPRR
jgi:hypothetical protein